MMENEINIMEAPNSGKKRIGFLCLPGLETFIKPIAKHFAENYEVRTYYGSDLHEINGVVSWANCLWIEWSNELAINMTQRIPALADKKVIVRCHSYEAMTDMIPQIKWSSVDVLLFVAGHIKDIVLKRFPKLKDLVKMEVVPNGV